jgi:hypothetical protein
MPTGLGSHCISLICAFLAGCGGAEETPPPDILAFIAGQLGIEQKTFGDYARRQETRWEHIGALQAYLKVRPFQQDLTVSRLNLFGRVLDCLHLPLPANEFGQPARGGALKSRTQGSEPHHFIYVDGIDQSLHPRGPARSKVEVTLDQQARMLGYRDRTARRNRFHPGSKVGSVSNRRVFGVSVGGG